MTRLCLLVFLCACSPIPLGPAGIPADEHRRAARLRKVGVLYRYGYPYKQAGIWLGDLIQANHAQPLLFERRDRTKAKRLMETLDRINKDEGSGCVRYAAEGYDRHWVPAFLKRSPRYTTRWDELPLATC